MSQYIKLFGSILDSTVWQTPPGTRLTWITMMAMADRDGIVEASVPGLALRAGVERLECERALASFLAPDPDSRTPEFEGRRIEKIDGGWRLLNHDKYRERMTLDEIRAKATARQKRWRERHAPSVTSCDVTSHVTLVDAGRRSSLHTETETHSESESDTEAKTLKKHKSRAIKPASPGALAVLDYLNLVRKRAIKGARLIGANPESLEHIEARLKGGYSVDDCKHVIDVCAAEVRQHPETSKWFNTVSPFRPDGFARKLGSDPDSMAASGHARAATYGAIEVEGDMTHLLGDYMAKP